LPETEFKQPEILTAIDENFKRCLQQRAPEHYLKHIALAQKPGSDHFSQSAKVV
jgi:hypothetical protein